MHVNVPYLQFRSNAIIRYTLPENQNFRTKDLNDRLASALIKVKTYTGMLCPGAKKRMTKAIEQLVLATRGKGRYEINPVTGKSFWFRLSFITLTVYSTDRKITANEAHKQCLEPFLQWMRRVHGVNLYIWKAEIQSGERRNDKKGRGQIHYHITSDAYIHFKLIQAKWNELQKKAGYLDSFYAKFGRWNAPSTEIKKVAKEGRLAAYFVKEFTKNIQNQSTVKGKVWDCSKNLKRQNYFTEMEDSTYIARLNKAIDEKRVEVITTETCIIYKTNDEPAINLLTDRGGERYRHWLRDLCYKEFVNIQKKKPVDLQPVINPPKKVNIFVSPDLFSTS